VELKHIIKEELKWWPFSNKKLTNQEIEDLIKSKIKDVNVKYIDFNGDEKNGIIQVNERIVDNIKNTFNGLYNIGFRINNIEPSNGRDDKELINQNITSCFNYRRAITPTGLGKLSKHAWGLAWDINPKVNPAEPNCGMDFQYGCEFGVLKPKEIDIIKSNGFNWGGEIFKSFYDSHHFEVPFTSEELKIQNSFKIDEHNIKNIIKEVLNEGRKEDVYDKYLPHQLKFGTDMPSVSTFLLSIIEDISNHIGHFGNNKYLDWSVGQLLELLNNDEYTHLDIPQMRDIVVKNVTDFHDNLKRFNDRLFDEINLYEKLPISYLANEEKIKKSPKDINSYPNLTTLKFITDIAKTITTKSEVKKLEADKIYEDNNVLIVSPKSHRASCYYGAKTKWCTTSTDTQHFQNYTNTGVLIYIINKHPITIGEHYQKIAIYIPDINSNGILSNLGDDDNYEVYNSLDEDITFEWHEWLWEDYWEHWNLIQKYFNKEWRQKYVN